MHRTSPQMRRQARVLMRAVVFGAAACGDEDAPSIVGSVTQQYIETASVGAAKATRRPNNAPEPTPGTQIVARFLNRTRAGGTGHIAIQSTTPVARIILAIEGTDKDYLEIVSPAITGEVMVSVVFASQPSTLAFNLRIAAASTAQGNVGEYALLPVDLTPRSGNPAINFSPTTPPVFDGTIGSAPPASKIVGIVNAGTGTLDKLSVGTITYSPSATAWLAAPTLAAQIAPTSLTIRTTTTNLPRGTHTATIRIVSLAADESPRLITVTYRISAPIGIIFSPDSVVIATSADQESRTVQIANGGDGQVTGLSTGDVEYDASPKSWLTAALDRSTSPPTAAMTAFAFGLGDGVHTASIPVRSTPPNVAAKSLLRLTAR